MDSVTGEVQYSLRLTKDNCKFVTDGKDCKVSRKEHGSSVRNIIDSETFEIYGSYNKISFIDYIKAQLFNISIGIKIK